ncbi:hypothetical protein PHYSODRAFT_262283 [Phytophthora sojae]|uniref:Crinkler effector protein N-terminal domain-containing protein n=1 Tax=Phytophthora sojae (strain P6497) TaxID=1094619 RepID=G5AHJ3_PHYSP|nr:hypothetical protein PHYSODRAFT_262283 [Phytophthora sojae]EGZ05035.1 hypothetical protein PHYSODRAFT_262283 [Phytophthora sojae]|eukprot:XP_009539544.1 hypothetical protein PHYSODRAFT_262283 [Phytophthora sojae]
MKLTGTNLPGREEKEKHEMERQIVKLFCGIVGARGSFPIEKNEIKKARPNACRNTDADQLRLFVPKEGGEWLTEAQLMEGLDADVTSRMKEQRFAQEPIGAIVASRQRSRLTSRRKTLEKVKGP